MSRKSFDIYAMEMAIIAATRSTCNRASVGAIITDKDNRIHATGYNGSAGSKIAHCDDVGHVLIDGHCVATVHAEQNAIADCARTGKATEGCSIYVTHLPCLHCTKLIIAAGIDKVYYHESYRMNDESNQYAIKLLKDNDIPLVHVKI